MSMNRLQVVEATWMVALGRPQGPPLQECQYLRSTPTTFP
jgi:hypothetical protein